MVAGIPSLSTFRAWEAPLSSVRDTRDPRETTVERILVLRLVHTVVEKDLKSGSEDPRFILDYQIASET